MDIRELQSFQLSDAVKFHDHLNPKIFHGQHVRPEVEKQLKIIAGDFLEELGVDGLDVQDITISGSNAAYSYTPHSDLDLHILVDMTKLNNDEMYRELFDAKKNAYNDSHDIKIHGIPVELYIQDSSQPVISLGEYSIKNNKWLKIPSKRRANFDQSSTARKYEKILAVIERALKTQKLDRVQNVIHTIKRYRQAGLDKGGEFGPENLAYKALRSQGYITALYKLRDELHSRELSIEGMYAETNKFLNKPAPTIEQLVIKYKVPKQDILIQLDKGIKSELKTIKDRADAREIALNNINSDPHYYNRLQKIDTEVEEDYDANGVPPGPEFKPTMPAGTVRVDVSDVYDWYKLGQYVSNLDHADPKMFGKGPPSTIMAFGSEPEEHKYINALKKLGLKTTDIDPVDPNQPKNMPRQTVDTTYNVNETSEEEIHNYHKLDKILNKLCEMVVKGQKSDKDYGMVAACVLDPDNNIVAGLNSPGTDGKRVHAERVAIEKYERKYGEIPEGSIVITTLSPCNETDDETAEGRVGESCAEYINSKGIDKVYCGYIDPTQDNDIRNFNLMETSNQDIRKECKSFADTFLKQDIHEGYSNTTFQTKRRRLNVPALIKAGALFVTYPHGEQGWETDNQEDWAYSLISLYNVMQGGWSSEAKKYLKPASYKKAEQQINSSAPNLGSDKLVYDGKYNQILWSIKKLGIPDNVAFLDNSKENVTEGFDQPYPLTWEKNEYDDVDALAKLPDGSPLSIMFNKDQDNDGEEVVQVEFYRNNSQEVTGEGDAMRVFATVLTAIQQYVKKYKPVKLFFSASKDNWAKQQQNSESRAKLYDRLVQRYSKAWGYRAFRADNGDLVMYELSRIKKPVAEASGYIPSEKEKNDPRFKTALTVDVKPDSIKKNAKAFSWLTSRAGVPPTASPSGKF